jgi:hypothetical protein
MLGASAMYLHNTFSQESCPNFQSSLDISVTGVAQANSEFGLIFLITCCVTRS